MAAGSTRLQPGSAMGPYRLVSLISRGGMGEVWRAQKGGESGWKKEVALKVMLPEIGRDQEQFVRQFEREARVAALLDHPNIVGTFAFGREGPHHWIEQELVDGEDLRRLLKRASRVSAPLALFIVGEVLKALQYALERPGEDGRPLRIIHRDIKPSNVLCAHEGHVKLADFGIAKITADGSGTLLGLRGTVGYLAPEEMEGQPASPASDVFAVGLVLWELLTGSALFEGVSEGERLQRTFDCVVPPLVNIRPDVPQPVELLLRRMLTRSPADRLRDASEALEALLTTPSGGRPATSIDFKRFLAGLPKWAVSAVADPVVIAKDLPPLEGSSTIISPAPFPPAPDEAPPPIAMPPPVAAPPIAAPPPLRAPPPLSGPPPLVAPPPVASPYPADGRPRRLTPDQKTMMLEAPVIERPLNTTLVGDEPPPPAVISVRALASRASADRPPPVNSPPVIAPPSAPPRVVAPASPSVIVSPSVEVSSTPVSPLRSPLSQPPPPVDAPPVGPRSPVLQPTPIAPIGGSMAPLVAPPPGSGSPTFSMPARPVLARKRRPGAPVAGDGDESTRESGLPPPAPKSESKTRLILIAAGVTISILAIVLTVIVLMRPSSAPEPAPPPQVAAPVAPEAVKPPPVDVPAPTAPGTATVQIVVRPEMARARVVVEGQPVSPPFVLRDVDTRWPMRVRVESPGFRTWERSVTVKGPKMQLPVDLEPGEEPAPPRPARAPERRSARPPSQSPQKNDKMLLIPTF